MSFLFLHGVEFSARLSILNASIHCIFLFFGWLNWKVTILSSSSKFVLGPEKMILLQSLSDRGYCCSSVRRRQWRLLPGDDVDGTAAAAAAASLTCGRWVVRRCSGSHDSSHYGRHRRRADWARAEPNAVSAASLHARPVTRCISVHQTATPLHAKPRCCCSQ